MVLVVVVVVVVVVVRMVAAEVAIAGAAAAATWAAAPAYQVRLFHPLRPRRRSGDWPVALWAPAASAG